MKGIGIGKKLNGKDWNLDGKRNVEKNEKEKKKRKKSLRWKKKINNLLRRGIIKKEIKKERLSGNEEKGNILSKWGKNGEWLMKKIEGE